MKRFEEEYERWLAMHIAASTGERRRRLIKRHGFGEKLLLQQAWWPVIGNLDLLHPEYEVVDANGNYYYMDIGYLRWPRHTNLEADGFNSHVRDIDRDDFSRGLDRQNEIIFGQWNVVRMSIDKLKDNPLHCQNTIRRMLETCYGDGNERTVSLPLYQREIMRVASIAVEPLTPAAVAGFLGREVKVARNHLHELVELGLLEADSGSSRIRGYRLKR